MKAFNRLIVAVLILWFVFVIGVNIFISAGRQTDTGRPYRVEISRIVKQIEQEGYENISLFGCEYVTDVVKYSEGFYESLSDNLICEVNGELYRFDYTLSNQHDSTAVIVTNVILAAAFVFIIGIILYVRIKIISPFDKLKELPYELSKGNLTIPVKETKSRFFGRFIWGVDLLRENMEEQKQRELELQKERKMLMLSLSHDIKTPLSAIKLYSKALSKGLYKDKDKQLEIADSINDKADEIEGYVSQIITASREDFLSLDVKSGEFYLSELTEKICGYYSEKLSLIKTDFKCGRYSDCLIKADQDRAIEVLQNVIENAVKYGDGKSIELSFDDEDGCILISVRNSGNTLSENEITHIFESFWRGENAENKNGSGLGLYICRQLMRKMNGEIFAKTDGDYVVVTAVFTKA